MENKNNPIFFDKDISVDIIKNKKIGIIGYGNQGRAQALNLRDSGINVQIGGRLGGISFKIATELGFRVDSIPKIVKGSDVIVLLVPDQIMGKIFKTDILPHLKSNQSLIFSHGYNIHYKLITPPKEVNIIMAAPSGAGTELRNKYEN